MIQLVVYVEPYLPPYAAQFLIFNYTFTSVQAACLQAQAVIDSLPSTKIIEAEVQETVPGSLVAWRDNLTETAAARAILMPGAPS